MSVNNYPHSTWGGGRAIPFDVLYPSGLYIATYSTTAYPIELSTVGAGAAPLVATFFASSRLFVGIGETLTGVTANTWNPDVAIVYPGVITALAIPLGKVTLIGEEAGTAYIQVANKWGLSTPVGKTGFI